MDNNRNNNLHAGLMDFIIDVTVKDPVSNPSISRHLDILKKAELVTCRRQGKYVIYSLNISLLQKLSMEILSFCDRKKDA
jgi:DNA-binding transcriptional ArsR family regulator